MAITAVFPTLSFPNRGEVVEDTFVTQFESACDTLAGDFTLAATLFGAQANALAEEVNTSASSASSSASSSALSEANAANYALIAQGAANFKGAWSSVTAYTVGQSVQGSDGVFYIALTSSTNQNPVSTTGYWTVASPAKYVGNITRPVMDIKMSSFKALLESYGGHLRIGRVTGGGVIDRQSVTSWKAFYTGTATAGSLFHFEKSTGTWTVGELAGYAVTITTGSITDYRYVVANSATSVSLDAALSTPATSSTTYSLSPIRFGKYGLRLEPASTNQSTYSYDFSGFGRNLVDAITAATTNIVGPDNSTYTYNKIPAAAGVGSHYINKSCTVTAGTTQTGQFLVKKGNYSYIRIDNGNSTDGYTGNYVAVNLDSKSVIASSGSYTAEWQDDGSVILSASNTPTVTTNFSRLFFCAADGSTASLSMDGSEYVYATNHQHEPQPSRTTVIPTTGATATRNAEYVLIDDIGAFPNLNDECTISVDYQYLGGTTTASAQVFSLYANGSDVAVFYFLIFKADGRVGAYVTTTDTASAISAAGIIAVGGKYRITASIIGRIIKLYVNGVLVATSNQFPSAVLQGARYIKLAGGGTNYTGTSAIGIGEIARARIWDKSLNAWEARAL